MGIRSDLRLRWKCDTTKGGNPFSYGRIYYLEQIYNAFKWYAFVHVHLFVSPLHSPSCGVLETFIARIIVIDIHNSHLNVTIGNHLEDNGLLFTPWATILQPFLSGLLWIVLFKECHDQHSGESPKNDRECVREKEEPSHTTRYDIPNGTYCMPACPKNRCRRALSTCSSVTGGTGADGGKVSVIGGRNSRRKGFDRDSEGANCNRAIFVDTVSSMTLSN